MPRDFANLSKKQQKRILKSSFSSTKRIRLETRLETIEKEPLASVSYTREKDTIECTTSSTLEPIENIYIDSIANNNNGPKDITEKNIPVSHSDVMPLAHDLRDTFITHNASQTLIGDVLNVLRRHGHQDLPKDARTFMNTPRSGTCRNILDIDGGNYIHFGLIDNIKIVVNKHKPLDTCLKLNINIDGLPIAKSSRSQFWPILGDIVLKGVYTVPFIIGVFHGFSKPKDVNEFLKPFIDDFKNLETNGIFFKGIRYTIKINAFICDVPAKAYILNTLGHTGYFSCSKCIVEGEVFEGKVIFLETNAALRTDESFRNKTNPEHHHGSSPLERLNIDMVDQFPLDYMHLILLGVTKKMISIWLNGNKQVRLTKTQISDLEEAYVSTKGYIIYEFARKPRSFTSVAMWKATEFRLFLLYIGPVILKTILSKKAYKHFLSLVVAVRLLCEEDLSGTRLDYAGQLMIYFVKKFGYFFGYSRYSHNIHNLIHVAADVRLYGPLDTFSAFKFENRFTKIKGMLKTSRSPLQQLYNRVSEEQHVFDESFLENNFPRISLRRKKIFKVDLHFATFSLKFNENCCLLKNGQIILIQSFHKIAEEIICSGRVYNKVKPFFNIPCASIEMLGISQVNNRDLSNSLISFNVDEISKKLLRLCLINEPDMVVIALLHH